MNIGLDLDEVTAEFLEHMIKYYNTTKKKDFSKKDFKSYKFWEIWGGTKEQSIKIADEFHDTHHFDNISPVENSIKSIKSLASKNKFYIITSRPHNWRTKTEIWVKRHLGDISCEVIYTNDFHKNQGKSKSDICIEMKIDVILEDNEDYSLDCARKGVKVILFDKPWNKKAKHKNIIRVHDWSEAINKINNL